MKKIIQEYKIISYTHQHHLEFLNTYALSLYSFTPQELLNEKLNPKQFLLFLVEGTVRIYSPRINGSLNQIAISSAPMCFGDMEFTNQNMKQFLIETMTPCKFICLDIALNKDKMTKDAPLLLYLLHSVSQKTILLSEMHTETTDIESRVLYYLDKESNNHEIHGVLQLSQHINCSRRQLQRILKKLADENIIVKKKKGVYGRKK